MQPSRSSGDSRQQLKNHNSIIYCCSSSTMSLCDGHRAQHLGKTVPNAFLVLHTNKNVRVDDIALAMTDGANAHCTVCGCKIKWWLVYILLYA